jgi:hypothetical protein
LPPASCLVSCSAYSSTLKMEATCSSETPVDLQRTAWLYIPDTRTLRHGPCVFVAAGTCSLSRCLTTIGETHARTHTQQGDLTSLLLFFQNKESGLNKKFWEELIACLSLTIYRVLDTTRNLCILYRGNVFAEPLSNNDVEGGGQTDRQQDEYIRLLALTYLSKEGLCEFRAVCESPPINYWIHEPIFMKFRMHIMAPELISIAYFTNASCQFVCLYEYPTPVARNVSVKKTLSLLGNGSVKILERQRINTQQ